MSIHFIKPMLAELAREPFDSKYHLMETKWDGVRCIAHICTPEFRLQGRNLNDITVKFPELDGLSQLPDCILDGEIVCLDESGRSVFNLIQKRIHNGNPTAIKWRSQHIPAIYEVFDVLCLNGENVMHLPLAERKILLNELPEAPGMSKTFFIPEYGKAMFEAAEKHSLEGIMAKDLRMPYTPGKRTAAWQKIKVAKHGEFTIVGYTEGIGWRKSTFGALVLADDGKYVGNVGSGFDEESLILLFTTFRKITVGDCPLADNPRIPGLVSWVAPVLRCRVKYLERSNDGKLRFPVFEEIERKDTQSKGG